MVWKLFRRAKDKGIGEIPQVDSEYREVEIDGEVYCVGRMHLNVPILPVPLDENERETLKLLKKPGE